MTTTVKCARCKQKATALVYRMMQGHRGYRRYRVCDRCARILGSDASRPDEAKRYEGARQGLPGQTAADAGWS